MVPSLMQTAQRERVLRGLESFFRTPISTLLDEHARADPAPHLLALFDDVARRVPAYRAFLAREGVDPRSVRTLGDFARLPLTSKESYLRGVALGDLCRDGRLEGCDLVAVSSGSTGVPTFWPRFVADELPVARRFEQVFFDMFEADRRRTLAVVCFPLGTWIGGLYTAACCRHLASKGYPITVVTPGNVRPEILRVVRELGPLFDQVVLLGYPPFLKDVVDAGVADGVDWSRFRIKLVLAGEVFSEKWRDLMAERAGLGRLTHDAASLYGTADAGVLGNETPLSICIRRFLAERPALLRALFGEPRLPTLVQFDPLVRYFEKPGQTLVFSGEGGVPLLRYDIADHGGILPFESLLGSLRDAGFDALGEMGRQDPGGRGIHALPFVYVFGRSHFVLSYYGTNLYPENVAVGLEQAGVKEQVTGKFVMEVPEDEDGNRRLVIAVELARGVEGRAELAEAVAASIQAALERLGSEYQGYVPPERRRPVVTLWPLGHPEHFPVGVKHRYAR